MGLNDEHRKWLSELDAKSRAKQEAFLDGIADKLKRPRVMERPQHPYRGAPEFWTEFEWSVEERIARFAGNFQAAGGHVIRLGGMDEARNFIAEKANETDAKYMIRQDQPELEELNLEKVLSETVRLTVWNSDPADQWKARAAEADIGIVMADYAAAYTGSITVVSAKEKGRSVSLLPTVLIVIIPEERLLTRLGEILLNFDQTGRENLPAGIHFISGPSRSADIENDLTIGVHGPGIVYALIVG